MAVPHMQQTLAELHNFYFSGDAKLIKSGENWLYEFSKLPEAWMVCDQLLMEGLQRQYPEPVLFFAARTLYSKLRFDFDQLPVASHESLKGSIFDHVARFAAGPSSVLTKLCVAVATLALHMNDGSQIVNAVIQRFGAPEMVMALLEVLTVLPEEALDDQLAIGQEQRYAFMRQLGESSAHVLNYLNHWTAASGGHVTAQNKILRCLGSWVRLGCMPSAALASSPLLTMAFDGLNNPQLFDESADLVVQVLRTTENMQQYGEVIAVVVPRCLALQQAYINAQHSEDDDVCRGLARIAAEMAESYMPAIIYAPEGSPVLGILDFLVDVCGHPESEEIGSITFNVFGCLSKELTSIVPAERMAERMQFFQRVLLKLLQVLAQMAAFPDDYEVMKEPEREDFKKFRYQIQDAILDATAALTVPYALNHLYGLLNAQMQQWNATAGQVGWRAIESTLFAIRAMGRKVPLTELQVLPQIMALLPSLPPQPEILYTATMVIGRYADWLAAQPDYISHLFPFVIKGLELKEVAPAAALSFNNVCDACADHLAVHVENVLAVFERSLALKLHLQDLQEIIDGVVRVLCKLPSLAAMLQYQTRLLGPFVQRIEQGNQQFSLGVHSDAVLSSIVDAIDAIATGFKRFEADAFRENCHPISEFLKAYWSTFQTLFGYCSIDDQLSERLCRMFKVAIRNSRACFQPLLNPFLTIAVNNLNTLHHTAYVFALSAVVAEFGNQVGMEATMIQLFDHVTAVATGILQNQQCFVNNPDLVGDYFDFVAKYFRMLPQHIYPHPALTTAFSYGLAGLCLHHKEARKSVVYMFERFLRTAKPLTERPVGESIIPTNLNQPTPYIPDVLRLLQHFGAEFVRQILYSAAEIMPSSRGQAGKLLMVMLEICNAETQQWLFSTLSEERFQMLDNQVKQKFLRDITTTRSERGCCAVFKSFAEDCRRASKKKVL
eukprot:TRINITY_DN1508_c0_g1_i1.p1 TRINITY_DN1508_c0_g1~~TRINITY_DN1508_c0_g1_i1.p1  ORF type:complete len:950 (+),score=152.02 TRINITY_DN1508_c0_g1_i1:48-2897(+)